MFLIVFIIAANCSFQKFPSPYTQINLAQISKLQTNHNFLQYTVNRNTD